MMLKLASQLARSVACRTVAEAHDKVAARAQRAAEWRLDKIRAIADAAVDAAAKGFSHEKLGLIDLASVKRDAIDHAMNNDKEPHATAKKAAGAVSVESLTCSCDASSSTAENKVVSPSKDHAADPAAEEKQGGRRGSESSKGKKGKNAKKAKKAKKAKGKHLPACSADKAVAAVQSASEDNDKGKTVMSAPGGALAVDKPQKKDSAVCLAEAVETVDQNPAEDIAAAVTPRIAASVATEAIADAGCNTGRNTTDAASIATASTSVGTSGACAAAVGRPNGSSDPISKSNGAIKIAAVMRTVAPLAKAPTNTAAHTNVAPCSKTQAEPRIVDMSSASSLFRSSTESQKAVARYNRFWASLPDPEGSGAKTTRRGRAAAARPAPQECDHLALIRDIHHFSSGAFAWYDLQISDDNWNEVVQKYSRPLTSRDLV
nr:hypothetical protein HK105_002884 [Polyrhizophydium stewartii]